MGGIRITHGRQVPDLIPARKLQSAVNSPQSAVIGSDIGGVSIPYIKCRDGKLQSAVHSQQSAVKLLFQVGLDNEGPVVTSFRMYIRLVQQLLNNPEKMLFYF